MLLVCFVILDPCFPVFLLHLRPRNDPHRTAIQSLAFITALCWTLGTGYLSTIRIGRRNKSRVIAEAVTDLSSRICCRVFVALELSVTRPMNRFAKQRLLFVFKKACR